MEASNVMLKMWLLTNTVGNLHHESVEVYLSYGQLQLADCQNLNECHALQTPLLWQTRQELKDDIVTLRRFHLNILEVTQRINRPRQKIRLVRPTATLQTDVSSYCQGLLLVANTEHSVEQASRHIVTELHPTRRVSINFWMRFAYSQASIYHKYVPYSFSHITWLNYNNLTRHLKSALAV